MRSALNHVIYCQSWKFYLRFDIRSARKTCLPWTHLIINDGTKSMESENLSGKKYASPYHRLGNSIRDSQPWGRIFKCICRKHILSLNLSSVNKNIVDNKMRHRALSERHSPNFYILSPMNTVRNHHVHTKFTAINESMIYIYIYSCGACTYTMTM